VWYGDSTGVTVDLGMQRAVDASGATDWLSDVEAAVGSAFADTLAGSNMGGETLAGLKGADVFVSSGTAMNATVVDYSLDPAGVKVNLSGSAANMGGTTVAANSAVDGWGTTDSFQLTGGGNGQWGISGTNLGDSIIGSDGNDWFEGRGGNDVIDGGMGTDTAAFSGAPGAVKANLGAAFAIGGATLAASTALDGLGGTDTLSGIENLTGSAFGDTLVGSAGSNVLSGGDGNDTLVGGAGADTLIGGNGNDVFLYAPGAGNDTLNGFQHGLDKIDLTAYPTLASFGSLAITRSPDGFGGTDSLITLPDGATILVKGADVDAGDFLFKAMTPVSGTGTIQSTATNELLRSTGTTSNDTYVYEMGVDGSDSIQDSGGTDTLELKFAGDRGVTAMEISQAGNNSVNVLMTDRSEVSIAPDGGGIEKVVSGNVTYHVAGLTGPTSFNDVVYGIYGDALTLSGSDGNDIVAGNREGDTLYGGVGSDLVVGGGGNDTLYGGDGQAVGMDADNNVGVSAADTLVGGDGNDWLYGGEGNDQLFGGAGNDQLDGGTGPGIDQVWYTSATSGVTVNLDSSQTTNDGQGSSDQLMSIEAVVGSNYADVLVGANMGSTLNGLKGADTFVSQGMNPTVVSYAYDTVGVKVNLGASAVVAGGVTVAGNSARDGWGDTDTFTNTIPGMGGGGMTPKWAITGSANADYIRGSDNPEDTIEGLGGNDTLIGGDGSDTVSFSQSTAGVKVNLGTAVAYGVAATTALDGFGGTDTLSGFENVTGSAFGDLIVGNADSNQIRAGDGNDTVDGAAGNDVLYGHTGNDTLTGGAGDDTLYGGDGYDPGTDVFAFTAGSGSDVIADFQRGFDKIDLKGYAGISSFSDLTLTTTATLGGYAAGVAGAAFDTIITLKNGDQLRILGVDDLDMSDFVFAPPATTLIGTGTINSTAANELLKSTGSTNDTYVYELGGAVSTGSTDGTDVIDDAGGTDTLRLVLPGNAAVTPDMAYTAGTSTVVRMSDGKEINILNNAIEQVQIGSTTYVIPPSASGTAGNDVLMMNYGDTSGQTLYGDAGDDIVSGNIRNDSLMGGAGNDIVIGGAGSDRLYGGSNGMGGMDLSADTLIGGDGDDWLYGEEGDDQLIGGAGNDQIDGGMGRDQVLYTSSTTSVTADLSMGTVTDGLGSSDMLMNVEAVVGSNQADLLIGGTTPSSDWTLTGLGGNDTFVGGMNMVGGPPATPTQTVVNYGMDAAGVKVNLSDNAVTLGGTVVAAMTARDGFGATDTFIDRSDWPIAGTMDLQTRWTVAGSNFADSLQGGSGDDRLLGAGGNDWINGGAGNDWVSFNTASTGAKVNLGTASVTMGGSVVAAGSALDGVGGTDTVLNVENVEGSNFADFITGSSAANTLTGNGGADTFVFTSLAGGNGTDVLTDFTRGSDKIDLSGLNVAAMANVTLNVVAGVNGGMTWDTLVTLPDGGQIRVIGVDNLDVNDFVFKAPTVLSGTGTIASTAANEVLRGGTTNDTYVYELGGSVSIGSTDGSDTIQDTGGTDTVQLKAAASVGAVPTEITQAGTTTRIVFSDKTELDIQAPTGAAAIENLVFTVGNVSTTYAMVGTNAATSGNDVLFGASGTTMLTLDGGDGNDLISGAAGNDSLYGGRGADLLIGGDGNDWIRGGTSPGDMGATDTLGDTLLGGAGIDTLEGGEGDDILSGGTGGDRLEGGAGYDEAWYVTEAGGIIADLQGNRVTDSLNTFDDLMMIEGIVGTHFADTLIGGTGSTTLTGLKGADVFIGADTGMGGGGGMAPPTTAISYALDPNAVKVNLTTGTGIDGFGTTDTFVDWSDRMGATTDMLRTNWTIIGSSFGDTITGSAGTDTIEGGAGGDTLIGGDGIDMLSYAHAKVGAKVNLGGTPATLGGTAVAAGQANDGGAIDVLSGFEHVEGSAYDDFIVGTNIDNTLIGGAGNDLLDGGAGQDSLVGGLGNDTLTGGVGNDILQGDAGNDTLIGGDGDDSLVGGDGGDRFVFSGSFGTDTIAGWNAAQDLIDLTAFGVQFNTLTINSAGSQSTVTLQTGQTIIVDGAMSLGEDDFALANPTVVVSSGTINSTAGAEILRSSGTLSNDTYVYELGQDGTDTIDDAGGTDTLVLKAAPDFSLMPSQISAVGGTTVRVQFDNSEKVDILNNSVEKVVLQQGAETHTYNLAAPADTATGTAGADLLFGNISAAVTLDGGAGDDLLAGNYMMDTLTGGVGNDVLFGGAGNDWLIGGTHSDSMSDTDTGGNDVLIGGAGDDMLYGGAGDDDLRGGSGNDFIRGGDGFDEVWYTDATSGVTVDLQSGMAQDGISVNGTWGNDTLMDVEAVVGSRFNDRLIASNGFSALTGMQGNDTFVSGDNVVSHLYTAVSYQDSAAGVVVNLSGTTKTAGTISLSSNQALDGFGGTDSFEAAPVSHYWSIKGSAFNDTMWAEDGFGTYMHGGKGADTLTGGTGVDGAGYHDDGATQGVKVNLTTAALTLGGTSVQANRAIDGFGNTDVLSNIENVDGTNFADFISGGAEDNTFWGWDGNDVFDSGAGNDLLSGDGGNDTLNAGLGNDNVLGGDGNDTVSAGDGADTVSGGTGNDVLRGEAGDDWLVGDDGDDTVDGGAGNDTLNGHLGNDTLIGGAGDDTLTGGTGIDVFKFETGSGNDRVTDFEKGTDKVDLTSYGLTMGSLNFGNWGMSTTIQLTGGASIMLDNVTDLTAADFILATPTTVLSAGTINSTAAPEVLRSTGTASNDTYVYELGVDGLDTIQDSGGTDTLKLVVPSNLAYEPTGIDLRGSALVVTFEDGNQLQIDNFTTAANKIENLQVVEAPSMTGTTYAIGSASSGTSSGSAGSDLMFGTMGTSLALNGGDGADLISGSNLDDHLYGEMGNDLVIGGAGNDWIYGGDGTGGADNDTFGGYGGQDVLVGGYGNDQLYGGRGDDELRGDQGNDMLDGGFGKDTAFYGASTAGVSVSLQANMANDGMGGMDSLMSIEVAVGSKYNDTLEGSDTVDTSLIGGGGNDQFVRGSGMNNYTLVSYEDNAGSVLVNLSTYSYTLAGQTVAAASALEMSGTTVLSTDSFGYSGGNMWDGFSVSGSAYNDILYGSERNEWFQGLGGNDTVYGNSGRDGIGYVNSDVGVVVNLGGTSSFVYNGVTVAGGHARDGIGSTTASSGTDRLYGIEDIDGSMNDDGLHGNYSDNEVWGWDGNDLILGAAGADTLWGDAGNDTLKGGYGFDTLFGGDGNDTLYAFGGRDTLDGGAGNDVFVIGRSVGAHTIYYFTQGADKIDVSAYGITAFDQLSIAGGNMVTLADGSTVNVMGIGALTADDFTFAVHATVNGSGTINSTHLFETLVGSTGADTYVYDLGTDSSDTIVDAGGVDTLQINIGNFIVAPDLVAMEASGNNLVMGFGDGTSITLVNQLTGGGIETLRLTGIDEDGTTDTMTLTVRGTSGATTGADILVGTAAGEASLDGNAGDDFVAGFAGNDTIYGGAGGDLVYGGDGDDVLYGDHTSITASLNGVDYDDNIHGGAGNDTIYGGLDGDFIVGGAGDDVVYGSNGSPGSYGYDWDTISYETSTFGIQATLTNSGAEDVWTVRDGIENSPGIQGTDTLHSIEWIMGSNFDDMITIDSSATQEVGMSGGAGNDQFFGRMNGHEQVSYDEDVGPVRASISTFDQVINGATIYANRGVDGWGYTDTFSNIDSLEGSSFDDILIGNGNYGWLTGRGGNDMIIGSTGVDMANYHNSDTSLGVKINLSGTAKVAGGVTVYGYNGIDDFGNTDTLSNVEGVTGTDNADYFWGGSEANIFRGYEGNDTMDGGAGSDTIDFSWYDTAEQGAKVNLGSDAYTMGGVSVTAGTARDGSFNDSNVEGIDTLISMENASGTSWNDFLRASTSGSTLAGWIGADTLISNTGNDVLRGDDSFFGSSADVFVFTTNNGVDVIEDFAHGQDKIDLKGYGTNWAEFSSHITTSGGNQVIDMSYKAGGGTITLQGVATLDQNDFIFS